jgi:preprotein translocase subunit SecF
LEYDQPKVTIWGKLKDIYRKQYKKLIFITITLLFLAIIQIIVQFAVTGDIAQRDISLKGGVSITAPAQADTLNLRTKLSERFPDAVINVRSLSSTGSQIGIVVEASDVDPEELRQAMQEELGDLDLSVEIIGSALGRSFFRQTVTALLIAFALMGIVVFITFRTFVPSSAVILSAFSDIIVTLAIVNIFGIRLSTAGIAAFLMIIGYSVDTDILLSSRVLKRREGTVFERILNSMKTGMTMTATTIAAVLAALIISPSPIIKQIMTILLIGLFVDILNTWIQNAGILRYYMEKSHESKT